MLTVLDLAARAGLNPKHVANGLNSHGCTYNSPCPGCGGDDRFVIWPNKGETGRFFCNQCRKTGDAIKWLMDFNGYAFIDAATEVGKELTAPGRSRTLPTIQATSPSFSPIDVSRPREAWMARAAELADWAHEQLLQSPEHLEWLETKRGIRPETVNRFRLGWIPEPIYRPPETWGLPGEHRPDGKPRMHWVPTGLLIPTFHKDRIVRLRVRRDPVRYGEARYIAVKGSSSMLLPIPSTGKPARRVIIVVESDLDALMLAQEVGAYISIVCLTTAQKKPDLGVISDFRTAAEILVATDADAAGDRAAEWWQNQFPECVRLRPDGGKDPGEMFHAGRDLRAWIRQAVSDPVNREWDAMDLGRKQPGKGEGARIASDLQKNNTPKGFEWPASVKELIGILAAHPVRIVKYGQRLEGLGIDFPEKWKKENWDVFSRLSDLVFGDKCCGIWIDTHPAAKISRFNCDE